MQGVLFLALGRLALIPAVVLVAYRILDAYAISIGLKRNTYMDGVIMKKTSNVFPDDEGKFGSKPSNQDVVVFHIGTRFNHPMGLFAPHVKTVSDGFTQMIKDLEGHSDEFGFLGATAWHNLSAESKNEILIVCYFRNVEGLHEFAHSPYHMKLWDWWNKTVQEMPHISIFHETYHVPAGNWETVHVNSHIAGLGSTVFKIPEEGTGKEIYSHPIVDASKGLLKTSAGRMGRSNAHEHEKLEVDPYDK